MKLDFKKKPISPKKPSGISPSMNKIGEMIMNAKGKK